jgi:hypothetical protein
VVQGCQFTSNKANDWGGMITNEDASLEVVQSHFANNTAAFGAAVVCSGRSKVTTFVAGCHSLLLHYILSSMACTYLTCSNL